MNRRSTILFAVAVGVLVFLFAGFVLFMERLGFFSVSVTSTDQGAKIIAAALALVGTFTGAVVSIIGVLLKFSIDQQTETRQASEAARTAALQTEAEQRLKLEAAVRALQLFSTTSGTLAPPIQRNGALFMLLSFAQYDLTLQLVDELLPKGELGAGAAASLLDGIIHRGDEDVQRAAIITFYDNAPRMVSNSSVQIPSCLFNWIPGLSEYVREWAIYGLARVMLARPLSQWSGDWVYDAMGVIAALSLAWTEEKTERLKQNAGVILRQLLTSFSTMGELFHPRMLVDTEKIRAEVASSVAGSLVAQNVVRQLEQWAATSTTQARQ